jgi:hypothetical protein
MASCIISSVSWSRLRRVSEARGKRRNGKVGKLNNLPACGFVEDEDLPVLKHCPHEAEKLPLAMRENIVCEDGVEAALRLNDIPEADVSEGFAELLVGELAGRVEVEPDACLQKERLLWERD